MEDLLGEARDSPDYKRHYGGQNAFSNGSNYLFADGHVSWHSAEFTATRLICCMDDSTSVSSSNIAGLQATNCGGGAGAGGTRRR